MKYINLWIIATILSCIALTVLAQEDIPKKVNLQPRRSIARGLQRTSTTTAPPPPPEDEEYTDEDQPIEEPEELDEVPESAPSSTEAPKVEKRGPRPFIRPFRSNDDLLSTLMKRRQETIKNPSPSKKPATLKPINKEKEITRTNDNREEDVEDNKVVKTGPAAPSPLPVKVERLGRKRFGSNRTTAPTKVTTVTTEAAQDQTPEVPEPVDESADVAETLVKRPGRSRFTYSRQYKH